MFWEAFSDENIAMCRRTGIGQVRAENSCHIVQCCIVETSDPLSTTANVFHKFPRHAGTKPSWGWVPLLDGWPSPLCNDAVKSRCCSVLIILFARSVTGTNYYRCGLLRSE